MNNPAGRCIMISSIWQKPVGAVRTGSMAGHESCNAFFE